jgi:hypothetical protein
MGLSVRGVVALGEGAPLSSAATRSGKRLVWWETTWG